LSFGGIPLTSGFIAKFSIFTAAYENGNISVVVFGVLTSAIALFFYLRVIVMLFFTEPKSDAVTVSVPSPQVSFVVAASVIVTIVLGVYPSLLLNSAQSFASFLR
jgi:NADH-quinone oxidoreductase subunit N